MSRRSFSRFFQHLGCWIFASHAEHVADHHHGPEADEVGRKIRCHLLQLKRSMFLCEWGECACQHFLTLTCRQTHTCDDMILPWVDDPSFLVWVQSTLFILSHGVYSFLNFTIISYHFRKFTLTPNGLSFSLQKTVVALAALTKVMRIQVPWNVRNASWPTTGTVTVGCRGRHQNWCLEEVAFCLG